MSDPLFWHRLQFGFTITYHYLFPQLTMGLALLIVVLKAHRPAHRHGRAAGTTRRASGSASSASTSRWASSPASRWSSSSAPTGRAFSRRTGGVIGQTLAMEGMFAFFLESSFLALLVWGERRLGRAGTSSPRSRSSSAAGSRATSSSRPTPSCSTRSATRSAPTACFALADFSALPVQPLGDRAVRAHDDGARSSRRRSSWPRSARSGRCAASTARRARGLAAHRRHRRPRRRAAGRVPDRRPPGPKLVAAAPAGGARRDGGPLRERAARAARDDRPAQRRRAPARQPDRAARRALLPRLRRLLGQRARARRRFPRSDWPDNIELLYYAFHIMVGPRHAVHRAHGARRRCCCWRGRLEREPLAALGRSCSPSRSRTSPTPPAG